MPNLRKPYATRNGEKYYNNEHSAGFSIDDKDNDFLTILKTTIEPVKNNKDAFVDITVYGKEGTSDDILHQRANQIVDKIKESGFEGEIRVIMSKDKGTQSGATVLVGNED